MFDDLDLVSIRLTASFENRESGLRQMATEETRAILDRALSLGMENYEAIADELLAENVITYGPIEDDHGLRAWKQRQASYLNAFPDFEFTIEVSLADGDMGAIRYTVTGTHTGDLDGIAPTGKRITFSGATFFRVADGKVVEVWPYPDRLGLLQQLGVIPKRT